MNVSLPDIMAVPGMNESLPGNLQYVVCVSPNFLGFIAVVAALSTLGFLAPVVWPPQKSRTAQSIKDGIFIILVLLSFALGAFSLS